MLETKEKEVKFNKDAATPMLKQYFRIKEENPQTILFFRVGDFYETYDEDARTISRLLGIVLTSRDAGGGSRINMAGVPYHSVDTYIKNLIVKGHRVAVCDQVEDPRKAKGIVKREVTKILTSGTILDGQMLTFDKNNFLLGLVEKDNWVGLSYADITTGEFLATQVSKYDKSSVIEEIKRINPSEIILSKDSCGLDEIKKILLEQKITFSEYGSVQKAEENLSHLKIIVEPSLISDHKTAKSASSFILEYLKDVRKTKTLNLHSLKIYTPENYLVLDSATQRNLELTQTILKQEKEGSLLWIMDKTKTAMGARLLRKYLLRPLTDKEEIIKRLDRVEIFTKNISCMENLRKLLEEIYDLERITAKIEYKTVNARDLLALKNSLKYLPEILGIIKQYEKVLGNLCSSFDTLRDQARILEASIHECPPLTIKEGNIIKDGYSPELDELRNIKFNAKKWIAQMENKEREETKIKSLKIKYNSVFGYYIEITKTNLHLVPEHYIRKQTVANGERFINQQLKEYEAKILGAEEKIKNLEYNLFCQIREQISNDSQKLKEVAKILAEIDFFTNLAYIALNNNYIRPEISDLYEIKIQGGRHPVVENALGGRFISNDTCLDKDQFLLTITGPNMAGKSTYLRQIALITIMAQVGSFVPAKTATIGIADKIFTRVGASDDLHLGQSTFMVEMAETANIVRNATSNSLILLDEIGRGTSTQEGLSIAWAVAEYIHDKLKAKTLFATHFHQLTQLPQTLKSAKNYRVDVKEKENEVIFLHKIVPGGADTSFALYVAYLAGIPKEIIHKAQNLLAKLEENKNFESINKESTIKQLTFFENSKAHPLLDEIKKIKIEELTPLEALNKLFKWRSWLREEEDGRYQ